MVLLFLTFPSSLFFPSSSVWIMNPTIRVVPWTTNQEFQNVFEWLYANIDERPDLVQLGVDRVRKSEPWHEQVTCTNATITVGKSLDLPWPHTDQCQSNNGSN